MPSLAAVFDRVSAYADSLDHRPVWQLTPHGREVLELASRRGLDIDVVPATEVVGDIVRADTAASKAAARLGWRARLRQPESGRPLAVGAGKTQLQAVDDLLRSRAWRVGEASVSSRQSGESDA
jgi:hypothetical protein